MELSDNVFEFEYLLVQFVKMPNNENEYADSLREELANLELKLSDKELNIARNLSSELYMLEDDEILDPYNPSISDYRTEVESAIESKEYIKALELLRNDAPEIDNVFRALKRAEIYEKIEFRASWITFLVHGALLHKNNGIVLNTESIFKTLKEIDPSISIKMNIDGMWYVDSEIRIWNGVKFESIAVSGKTIDETLEITWNKITNIPSNCVFWIKHKKYMWKFKWYILSDKEAMEIVHSRKMGE
jgi:hypothetical protein